jgi:hypothetical protein
MDQRLDIRFAADSKPGEMRLWISYAMGSSGRQNVYWYCMERTCMFRL